MSETNRPDDSGIVELPPFDQLVEGANYQIAEKDGTVVTVECRGIGYMDGVKTVILESCEEDAAYVFPKEGWNEDRHKMSPI